MLEIKNLFVSFQTSLFENAGFCCYSGDIVSIYGKSGCGKTTLLKYIMGEVDNVKGELFFHGQEINDNNRDDFLFNNVSYIDQMGSYFENMTVYDHFKFYARIHNIQMNKKIALKYLNDMNLGYVSLKKVMSQLSTGERKRVLLTLSLMMKKKIIIMDEPTASIDQKSIDALFKNIQELSLQGITFIIATHDPQLVELSNKVYTVENKKLISKKMKNNEVINKDCQNKKPNKIFYFRYKTLKMKILFLFIILIGGIGLSYISKTIVDYFLLQNMANSQLNNYQNTLYLMKLTDPRYDGEAYMNSLMSDLSIIGYDIKDIISQQELNEIKQIDGVVDIVLECSMPCYGNTIQIQIYQNNEYIKSVSTLLKDDEMYNHDIYITAYYPEEKIMKNGNYIDGVYINESLEKMLDMDTLDCLEISFPVRYSNSLSYSSDYEGYKTLQGNSLEADIKIAIDGVLTSDDYDDGKEKVSGRIFVPIDQFEELVNRYFGQYESNGIPFQSCLYKIICEEGKEEQVKIAVEEMNELYFANNKYLSQKSIIEQSVRVKTSSSFMTILMCIIIVLGIIMMSLYYSSQRKKEMILLKREGLSRYIQSYFNQDNIVLLIGWYFTSFVILAIVWHYFTDMKYHYSIYNYASVWIIVMSVLSVCIIFIKIIYEINIKRRVIVYDKSKSCPSRI